MSSLPVSLLGGILGAAAFGFLLDFAKVPVFMRIPGQGEKDSGVNAKTIPGRWRTGFRADREQ
jgi:hypothetical protein